MKLLLTLSLFCHSSFAMYPSNPKAFSSDCLVECQDTGVKSPSTPRVRFDLLRPGKIIEDLKKMKPPENHQGVLQVKDFEGMRQACALMLQGKSFTMNFPYPLPGVTKNYNDCFVLGEALEEGLETVYGAYASETVRPAPFTVVNGFITLLPPQIESFLYYAKKYQNHLPLCHRLMVLQKESGDEKQQRQEREDLLQCTSYFSPGDEAQIIATKHRSSFYALQWKEARYLSLQNISCVQGPVFSQLPFLEQLSFYSSHLGNGDFLKHLQSVNSLKSVRVENSHLNDLTSLACLKQIQWLYLEKNQLLSQDITPIVSLTQLSCLYLDDFSDFNDIARLAPLSQLATLSISGSSVSNLKPLAQFPLLDILRISQTKVTDFTPLLDCSILTSVNTWGLEIDPLTSNALNEHLKKNKQKQQQEKNI